MSKNLVKQFFTVVSTDEKRMIDTNALVQKRLDELEEKLQEKQNKGFVAGLVAEEVELSPELITEMESPELLPEEINRNAQETANAMLEQAKEEADRILATAQAEAMRIQDNAVTQAEIEKGRIFAEAKDQGYSEGIQQAQMTEQAVIKEYEDKARQLEELYQQQLDNMEPDLVEVITDIYEHIFHVELRSYREILSFLISSAMRKIEGGHDFIIHVSKEDYPYVSMQKKQIMAGAVTATCSVEVIEDITLSKNQCLIETENGIFDCGLGTQLEELRKKIRLLSWDKEE